MKRQRHLVVFVKAPRLGAVKTRLARDIGALAAWRFYRETTARTIRRLGHDPRWRFYIAVAPDRFARRGRFWPSRLARRAQGSGDLGARMERVMRDLPPGAVVIVGSDIPELSAPRVAGAFRALESHDAVFGPAPDGGYWLVGASRRGRRRYFFHRVRWSTCHALADTLANLGPGTRIALLEQLADIDTGADLVRAGRGTAKTRA
ncbi:MAG: TIGR04282 family arsenosugar biosynthesis glycosyltransferase [Alphaproteobacteria bacterium]